MYIICDVVIELIDCAFWEVYVKDMKVIDRLRERFKEIELLDPDLIIWCMNQECLNIFESPSRLISLQNDSSANSPVTFWIGWIPTISKSLNINVMSSHSYNTYDPNGNQTSLESFHLNYDPLNQLVGATSPERKLPSNMIL